jgi:hypothetical protein
MGCSLLPKPPSFPPKPPLTASAYGLALVQIDPPQDPPVGALGGNEMVVFFFGGVAGRAWRSAGVFAAAVADCFAQTSRIAARPAQPDRGDWAAGAGDHCQEKKA